jgi:hypothetical protein
MRGELVEQGLVVGGWWLVYVWMRSRVILEKWEQKRKEKRQMMMLL